MCVLDIIPSIQQEPETLQVEECAVQQSKAAGAVVLRSQREKVKCGRAERAHLSRLGDCSVVTVWGQSMRLQLVYRSERPRDTSPL